MPRPPHFTKPLFAAFLLCLALRVAPAGAQTAVAPDHSAACLVQYQVALDQLTRGQLDQARATLTSCVAEYGNQPDLNLLLGYILSRQGNGKAAQEVLAPVADRSPLAASMTGQLQQLQPVYALDPGAMLGVPTGTATGDFLQSTNGTQMPVVRLPQSSAKLESFEALLAELVNQERVKVGLDALAYDPALAEVARAHSAEMRDQNYFAHESPTPGVQQPVDRYQVAFGHTPPVVAENVYRAWGGRHELTNDDIQAAHTAFMNSQGHRENILYPNVTRLGIGIVTNADGDIWVTEMFTRVERLF